MLRRRARRRVTACGIIRTWEAFDGRHAVEEVVSTLGLSKQYLVTKRLGNGNSIILYRSRKRPAAVNALAKHIESMAWPTKGKRKPVRKQQKTLF